MQTRTLKQVVLDRRRLACVLGTKALHFRPAARRRIFRKARHRRKGLSPRRLADATAASASCTTGNRRARVCHFRRDTKNKILIRVRRYEERTRVRGCWVKLFARLDSARNQPFFSRDRATRDPFVRHEATGRALRFVMPVPITFRASNERAHPKFRQVEKCVKALGRPL